MDEGPVVADTSPLITLAGVGLLHHLGLGEAAAISLAINHNARAVLIDDKLARNVASAHQLPVVGTMAILLRAKRQSLIPSIRPIVDEMIAQGRRIGGSLRQQILRAAGEEIEKA